MHRNFKQSYTEAALEAWILKLKKPWESQFSKETLALGRDFYKQGILRSLVLDTQMARAYTKYEGVEEYVMVELIKQRWCVRGSYKEGLHNEALGVAALYEIEELLAQALPPLPPVDTSSSPAQGSSPVNDLGFALPPRPLGAEFQMHAQGLLLSPFWKIEGDKRWSTFDAGPLSKKERALLIQLAVQAKKAGFKVDKVRKAYVLKEIEAVPAFMKGVLPGWGFIQYTLPPALIGLKVYTVQAQLKAFDGDEGYFTLDLSLYFYKQGQRQELSLDQKQEVLEARKVQNAIFFDAHGIVNIALKDHPSLDSFLEISPKGEPFSLPKYQLLSLHPKIDAQLDLRLSAWKKEAESRFTKEDLENRLALYEKHLPSFLRPYQKEGVLWLHRLCRLSLHPLLADDMGLGKTVQVLSFLHAFARKDQPSLIVCPSSVLSVWQKEIHTYFSPKIQCYLSPKRQSWGKGPITVEEISSLVGNPGPHPGPNLRILLLSYGQLRQNYEQLKLFNFEYLVLDEAQYIKNPASKTSKAACSLQAQHRIALSGTPIENHLEDIASIFNFLMPGLLGTRRDFQSFYSKKGQQAGLLLKEQLQGFILRRLKEEATPDLPEKTEMVLYCPLTPLQKKLYLQCTKASLDQLGKDLPSVATSAPLSLLTALLRLRQICCAPFLLPRYKQEGRYCFEHSSKLKALLDVLPSLLERGHKVVVFSQFTSLLEPLKDRLESLFSHCPIYYLNGKTQDRAGQVESFQNEPGSALFLLSLKAGGTGLTLHAADYAFLLDPWWNPAVEEQAVNRLHRLGQRKPVFIYRLITPGTVEERIQGLKQFKHGLAEGVLGSQHILQALASAYSSLRELIEYQENKGIAHYSNLS